MMRFNNIVKRTIGILLPPLTQRRYYYEVGIAGIRIISKEGWGGFWFKLKQFMTARRAFKTRNILRESINLNREAIHQIDEVLCTTVSVVIPTKNAGPDFEKVLGKLRVQRGIRQVEIVVMDSGSTDDTVQLALKFGATVHKIKPEEFSHSKTRNLGATRATGDFVVFMTQDAIPCNDYLLVDMVKVMQADKKIAAVCPRQQARSDADLYAAFNIWHYNNIHLELKEDMAVSIKSMNIPPSQQRKLANITDVCCCQRRKLFLRYLFRGNYAEDLDTGVRLLKDGYKLAYLENTSIVHSHNRPPSYTLRANYVTNRTLPKILGGENLFWNDTNAIGFLPAIYRLYAQLNAAIAQIRSTSADEFVQMQVLLNANKPTPTNGVDDVGEPSLDSLLPEIDRIIGCHKNDEKLTENVYATLLSNYVGIFPLFNRFMTQCEPNRFSVEDLQQTFYKLFASGAGAELGNIATFYQKYNLCDETILKLDKLLYKDI